VLVGRVYTPSAIRKDTGRIFFFAVSYFWNAKSLTDCAVVFALQYVNPGLLTVMMLMMMMMTKKTVS